METKKSKLWRIIAGALFIAVAGSSFFTMMFNAVVFHSTLAVSDILIEFLINSGFIVSGVFLIINKNDIPVIAGFGVLTFMTTIVFFQQFINFFRYPDGLQFFYVFVICLIQIALYIALTGFSVLRKIKPQMSILRMWFIPSAIGVAYFFFYSIYRIIVFFNHVSYDGFYALSNFSSYTTLALLTVAGAVMYSMLLAEKSKEF